MSSLSPTTTQTPAGVDPAVIAELHAARAQELQRIKARLAGLPAGKKYWRSLEELADTPEFQTMVQREFPQGAADMMDPVSRRQFLTLMGASLALAGLTGCGVKGPEEKIYPYVRQPESMVPGKPLFFASAMPFLGYAQPLLVESHMGRPTKIEGNPDHPASLGSTSTFAQAAILNMYDPDRPRTITQLGDIRPWNEFVADMAQRAAAQKATNGAGLRILSGAVTSPSLAAQMETLLALYPEAKWVQYEPVGRDAAREGARIAFGRYVEPVYNFANADVVLALDSDFMIHGPGAVRHARNFADRRRVRKESTAESVSRLYVVEPTPTNTGMLADHRIPLRASEVESFARAVAVALGVEQAGTGPEVPTELKKLVDAIAADLRGKGSRALVVAGDCQPAVVHALAFAMNEKLANQGSTVTYTEPAEAAPANQREALKALTDDMAAGKVEWLLIAGCNPVYDAPEELNFAKNLDLVGLKIHLSPYFDETSELCQWHIPECHFLEAWGDARTDDGSVALVQPLIAPLFGSKTPIEVVHAITGEPPKPNYDLVKEYWQGALNRPDFDNFWAQCIHDGFIPGTALAPVSVSLAADAAAMAPSSVNPGEYELVLRPDPAVFDGRFANNGWLQEVPRPFSKLTWDNAALMSPSLAEKLGVKDDDVVAVQANGKTVELSVLVQPGHAPNSVTVHLGYGRTRGGKIANGVGASAVALQTFASPFLAGGVEVTKTGRRSQLARTQMHWNMEGRHLVRSATFEKFQKDPEFVNHYDHVPPATIIPSHKYPDASWGMVIDLNVCNGCNACVVACNAENNIAVVGKEQVIRGREMHWMRIDQYYEGEPDNPELLSQPLNCQHCENAPCEVVCPVAATVHGDEGTNDMVYNRCVGTRFCANNCPYKVRRFNFFEYQDYETDLLKMARNPNVTVRTRGVIEKCSFCIQRLNAARIDSKVSGKPVADGEVRTACQAACPTQAIVFGNLNDADSAVSKAKAEPHNYSLLAEYNTTPRVTYLAAVRNPNPALVTEAKDTAESHG